MRFSVVIPNWNGRYLLKKNLPAVIRLNPGEIVLVDDGSTDGSLKEVENLRAKSKSSKVKFKIIENKKNLGFARALNQGVKEASGEIVIALNTDVTPQNNFLKILEKHFADEKAFGVSLNEINKSYGWTRGIFKEGFVLHEDQGKSEKAVKTFWVSGGSGAFRRSIWLTLGGLFEDFKFYWEDLDICYRAQKRGWICLWEPEAKVIHEHEASVRKRNQAYMNLLRERNYLWFIWRNLTDEKMIAEHCRYLFKKCLIHPKYLLILLFAIAGLPKIIPFRRREQLAIIKDDREILTIKK